jgi:hypothetical protein
MQRRNVLEILKAEEVVTNCDHLDRRVASHENEQREIDELGPCK